MKKIINLITKSLAAVTLFLLVSGTTFGQCPAGQTQVCVTYVTGGFNAENGWLLWNATSGSPQINGGQNPAAGTTMSCVNDGDVLELYAFETFGDGWCAPASIKVATCESGSVNGCASQNDCLFGPAGGTIASGNGTNTGIPGAGTLAFSGSVACIVPTCTIECPDDIDIPTDPGVCEAFVELPDPVLMGDCISAPVGFVEIGGCLGLPSYGVTGTGLDKSEFSLSTAGVTLPAPCSGPGAVFDMEICLTADWGAASTFESSVVTWGTCLAPGAVAGTLGLGGVGDCNEDCITVQVTGAMILSGSIDFFLGSNFSVDNICGGDDEVCVSLMVPTGCDAYDVLGASADGIYPVGQTCITYVATGSGTGSGAPPVVTCEFKINVTDQEAPVFNCPNDLTVNLQGGECCQLIDCEVTATDNCPVTSFDLTQLTTLEDPMDSNNAGGSGWSIYFNVTNTSGTAQYITEFINPLTVGMPSSCTVLTGPPVTGPPPNAANWTVVPSVPGAWLPGVQTGVFGAGSQQILIPGGIQVLPGASVGIQINCIGGGPAYYNGPCPTVSDGTMSITGSFSSTTLSGGGTFSPRCFAGSIVYAPQGEFVVQVGGLPCGSEFPIGTTVQSYTATDDAGNVGTCEFNITVNEIPESTIVTSLTCNDNINVSIDENCEVFINADMFLEGTNYGCYFNCYEVYIKDEHGHIISSTCADPEKGELFPDKTRNPIDVNGCKVVLPCGTYTYEVYDACRENLCWGTFTVEDKIAPELVCPGSYTVNCTESTEPVVTIQGVNELTTEEAAICWGDGDTGDFSTTYDFGPVSPSSIVTDVNINIVLDHSWMNDVTAELTSPSGTTVTLFNPIGFLDHNVNCTFDESSPLTLNAGNVANLAGCNAFGAIPDLCATNECDGEAFQCALIGTAFGFGSIQTDGYTPGGGLDAFNGEPAGGIWTLTFNDAAGGDGGCLNTSTLSVGFEGPGVPTIAGILPGIPECADNSSNAVFEYGTCGGETARYTDDISGTGCGGSQILRTWVGTDAKGNTGSCTQTITVESIGIEALDVDWFWPDMNVPTIACLDGSFINPNGDPGIHLTCGADASPEGIMKYFYAQYAACVPPPSPDADEYPEYRANLKRFARSKAFPYVITHEGCDSDTYPFETAVSFLENSCNMIFTYADHVLPACGSDCAGNEKVIREWTALDWCTAETITKTQIIHSKDNEGPLVDLNAAFGVQSTATMVVSADPWGCVANFEIPAPEHLIDNCSTDITYTVSGPATVSYQNGSWYASGAPRGAHTFTYTAVDCCGNEGTGTLLVIVVDNTPPIPVVIRDVVVGMTYSPTNPEAGSAKVYVDQIDNGSHDGDCGRVKVVIRRMDEESCGNLGVNDHNNNNTFFNFNDQADNAQNPISHDRDDTDGGQFVKFCCNDLLNTDFEGGDTDGDGINDYVVIPVEIGVWDDADGDGWPGSSFGDRLSVTWANVRLEAKVAPVLNCPPDAAIDCSQDENAMLVIQSYLGGFATAVSNCGVLDVEYTDECADDFNKACHHGTIIRTWSIPGTEVSCEQTITVREPGDGFTEYFSGSYYLVDANGDYILQGNGRPIENDNVTFPHEGDAVDVENDDFDDFSEVELDCIDGMITQEPSWVAEGCGLIGWSLESDTIYLEGDACVKIINKYCVIDWCQYDPSLPGRVPSNGDMKGNEENPGKWCWTVIGKLRDEIAPSVSASDVVFPANGGSGGSGGFPTSFACGSGVSMAAVSNDDASDCPSDWIKWVVIVDSNDDGTPNWEWSSFIAEDDPNQIPCWTDSNGNGIPDVRVGSSVCDFDSANSNGTAPGEEYRINLPVGFAADCDGSTRHKVSWTAYDGCGNISSTHSYFTVQDQKAPTPYCVNLSTALMDIPVGGSPEDAMVELWAIDFDRGSFDNCSADEDLLFTFTDDPSTVIPEQRSAAMTFTCDDLAGGNPALLTLPIYVWDGCGNRDFCLVNLRLTDNNGACGVVTTGSTIAGVITTEVGETVEDVEVMNERMDNTTSMLMNMTDDIGHYEFADNASNEDYEISARKDNDYLNGVSTIDLVKIQRHILGLELLDSPYKLIAADVNSDGAIDGRDLVELRKLILGIYTELPQNGSWRFIDATQTLDIANPWNFSETLYVPLKESSMMAEDFIGVKVGDVNNSAIANLNSGSTEFKSGDVINVQFADVQVVEGQEVEVQVNAEVADLYGYQFTMSTTGLELVNVVAGDLDVTEANFGIFDNVLTTSWNSTKGLSTSDNLFTMTFKSNVSGSLSEILGLNSSITSAEAYVGKDLEIVDIALNNVTGSSDFALLQNEPNPFSTTTEIGFVMPEAADAKMTVYDVTGKIITIINGNYAKGYNSIELSKSELGASGVLYYQLDSGDFTATKKMIIIE